MKKFTPVVDRIEYGGALLGIEEVQAVMNVMLSQGGKRWTVGPESIAFEKELAENTGVKRAVVVNSGSSALLIALTALKLPKGSAVIIPALNFPTAFNAILQCGLIPYVVDINPHNLLLDLEEVKKAVERHAIAAVMAINIASNPVDTRKLREIVGEDVKIILDNCLAKGTLVKTNNGDIPIEKIKVGDMVLTRKGYKKVLRHMNRGVQPVMTRFGVTATADHPFITTKGKKEFDVLKPSDILYSCALSTMGTNTIDILNQNTGIKESIGTVVVKDLDTFTAISGKINTEKSQKDTLSTTKTATLSITKYPTLRQSRQNNILRVIFQKMEDWKLQIKTSIKQGLELLNGTSQMQERNSTLNTISGSGQLEKNPQMFAQSANKNIKLTTLQSQSFAQESVSQEAEVYDLTVEDAHEFFANGILVSNCDGYGSLIDGQYVDKFADMSCVSFHAAHIITMGEGGAVLTDNEELANRVLKLREWGRASGTDDIYEYEGFPDDYRSRYVYEEIGYNMKPLELQCAMGRVQLKRIEDFREKRLANFGKLMIALSKYPQIQQMGYPHNAEVCWFSFPMMIRDANRGKLMAYLEKNNIECRTIFSGNVLRHPAYKNVNYIAHGEHPVSDDVMKNGMFLSVHPSITDDMIKFIDQTIGKFLSENTL